jgi:hypothetical protein
MKTFGGEGCPTKDTGLRGTQPPVSLNKSTVVLQAVDRELHRPCGRSNANEKLPCEEGGSEIEECGELSC